MTKAWDTTLISRLYPGGALERHLLECAHAGEPVAITAPTVMEVVRGLQSTVARKPQIAPGLAWFVRLLASDLVEILSLDRSAAIVAGRLRATHPTPPTGTRRKGVKPEQRAGWVLDVQIAACAWTHGREIATENLRDFEVLRDLIAQLYPDTTPLVVTASPAT
ncbi:MAG: PIN domain-containing protein [Solirubrobacterales bacterium]